METCKRDPLMIVTKKFMLFTRMPTMCMGMTTGVTIMRMTMASGKVLLTGTLG